MPEDMTPEQIEAANRRGLALQNLGHYQTVPGWHENMTVEEGRAYAQAWEAANPGYRENLWRAWGLPEADVSRLLGIINQPLPGTTAPSGGATYPAGQTSAQRAALMLYNAMRGLPFISPEFLSALQVGQAPAPRTVTPQTLAALAADSTLSDAFFSVIRGNALYPESYLAEIGRYIPKGAAATPSFI